MKTRYFVSDRDCENGDELFLTKGEYRHIDGSFCCVQGSAYELNYITKVEEMELSDFIADGRTKYELNGFRFVVEAIFSDGIYVKIESKKYMNVFSRNSINAHMHHYHIEDIKLATTCEQCGKDEVQDAGLCSDCISKLPKFESRKVVDIHKSENGSFSVGSVVNMCEHGEIVYTSSQYVEAIEKEFPDAVNHPSHYTAYKGIEVIQLTEQMNFNRGNAVKYIARAGLKNKDKEVEDLQKAIWYSKREIQRIQKE